MRQYTALLLIALVGISMASKSPADAVVERIDNLVQASRNEQAEQTRIYVAQSLRCKEEKTFRTKEINDASVSAGSADQQLQICNAEVPVAEAALRQSQAELAATNEQLNSLNIEYNLYQSVNLQRQKEHQETLQNIQGAYNIIGNFANGKEALSESKVFLQVTQKINSIFKLAIKHKFHQQMVPVMSALVQVTQSQAVSVPTSALTKVVTLLRQLEANVRKSDVRREEEWKAYEDNYHKQKALLEEQVTALGNIIVRYGKYLDNLATCQRKESEILRLAQAKQTRNTNILNASVEMCNAYDAKFQVQTEQRRKYIEDLSQLRAVVVSSIASYNSGLYSNGDFTNQVQMKQKLSKN